MGDQPMTLEEAVKWADLPYHERCKVAEQFGGPRLQDQSDYIADKNEFAYRALMAHARATLAQRREGVTFVCGGTPTPAGQRELDDFATYLRVKGRIEKQNSKQRREGASAAMVPLARLGLWALEHIRGECAGDIDAFDLQDEATKLGVIAAVKAPRPCGACCVCEEMESDVCYRDTDATKAARAALAASGEGA